jgi:hypothetical protein
MNKHLVQLIDLAQIDSDIDSFGPKEEAINQNLNSILEKIESNNAQVATLEQEISDNKMKNQKAKRTWPNSARSLMILTKKMRRLKTKKR